MGSYKLDWLQPERVLLIQIQGDINEPEMLQFDASVVRYLDNSSADQVHVIFDNGKWRQIPNIGILKRLQFAKHERLGWGVSYNDTSLTRFFMSAFRQMAWLYFHNCHNLSDCLLFLTEMDPTLQIDIVNPH